MEPSLFAMKFIFQKVVLMVATVAKAVQSSLEPTKIQTLSEIFVLIQNGRLKTVKMALALVQLAVLVKI